MLSRYAFGRVFFGFRSLSGRPVDAGQCVMPDSTLQTFTLQIHSSSAVDRDVLKNLIQQKFKVLTLEKTAQTILVK